MAGCSDFVIKWSKKNYNLRDFLKEFDLPQIVKFSCGWLGNDEHETISGGQVMRMAKKFAQERVIATDQNGRHISIPRNYEFRFYILSGKTNLDKSYTIDEILKNCSLPQTIQLAHEDRIDVMVNDRKKAGLGILTLLETHSITYLAGNSMQQNSIMPQPTILPIYIQVEVMVAKGLLNGTKKDWTEFKQARTRLVERDVIFNPDVGNDDISIYGTVDVEETRRKSRKNKGDYYENIYDLIEPELIAQLKSKDPPRRMSESGAEKPSNDHKGKDMKRLSESNFPPDYTKLIVEMNKRPYQGLRPSEKEDTQDDYEYIDDSEKQAEHLSRSNVPPVPPKQNSVIGMLGIFQEKPPLAPKPRPKSIAPKVKEQPTDVPKVTQPENVVEKVPENLERLSIQGVCDHLKKLNLGKYQESFKDVQVDGKLLCNLTKEMMKDDFGMTAVEALKLHMSLDGWRPE
ncbi:uncharacterized protein LOC144444657 [Glandiceps talaboti]